ncbi:N-acetyltransferase [Stagnimonas aquatica]|uniref:N-acetyltransferase n=1 Tax=Stagnimonas aquatica TaxID=2689987 RepID=A0A3N0V8D1_9GAMM|nr:GNAT family N-acetyltransferase [Stagnimonas aquatica]ROH89057.1 N-acetyltransferase [Stagnimonas aquatica]
MSETASAIAETRRLRLRPLRLDDAAFILRLVNEPGWLRYIGDKQVHTLDAARDYLRNGPLAMYAREGFGLWLLERLDDGLPLGLCGLIKRDSLPDPDIGFALLSEYEGQGYAREAAEATLALARTRYRLARVLAITSLENPRSIGLLQALGFAYLRQLELGTTTAPNPVRLFCREF